MKLHEIVIGIIVIGMATIAISMFITDGASNYQKTVDMNNLKDFNNSLEYFKNISTDMEEDYGSNFTMANEESTGFWLSTYDMIKQGWKTLKLTFASVNVIKNMLSGTCSIFYLPQWVCVYMGVIFSLLFFFMILYFFIKWYVEVH